MPPPPQPPVAAPARAVVVGRTRAVLFGVFVVAIMTGRLYFETPYLQQILQQQQRQRPQFYTADEDAPLLLRTATPRPKENGTPTTSAAAAATAAAPGDVGGVTTRNDDRPPVRMTPSTSTTKSTQRKTKKKFFALHIGPSKTGTSTIVSDSGSASFPMWWTIEPRLVDSRLRPLFILRFINFTCFTFFFFVHLILLIYNSKRIRVPILVFNKPYRMIQHCILENF